MSSKDKENTLNKIKQFFRSTKTTGGVRERLDISLSYEMERELRPETPIAQRCKALKDLGEAVSTNRLEDSSVKKLWELTKDLIVPNKPAEQRQVALTFYRKLIEGQFENLSLMRAHFFRVIQDHDVPEDLSHRLDLLKSLTENGKNIQNFDEEIGRFMLQWVQPIVEAKLTVTYLGVLINIIKYNAAYLDKVIVVGIVQNVCYLCCYIEDTNTVKQCLTVLETVICYTIFPNETLTILINTLCRTVNRESYCQLSWKIMRNLLGTHLGHASLLTMCHILNDKAAHNDEALLRGAVFYINMGLWGSTGSIVPMLRCSPSTVLLSFLNALQSEHTIVTYEVALSMQTLIQKFGSDLGEPAWDVICDILGAISENIKKKNLSKDNGVTHHFHEILDIIEQMLKKDDINADPDKFFSLIERVSESRSESSIKNLIEYKSISISATRPQWLQSMSKLMEKFYKQTTNSNIRVYTVQKLMHMWDCNRAAYEEEILERVVMVHLSNIAQEQDLQVRVAVAILLIELTSHCDTKRCLELLDIIEKFLNRPFELYSTDGITIKSDNEIQDIIILVDGLIKVFLIKLYRLPSSHAIKIFDMLIKHLEQHYETPMVFENACIVRYEIFNWMLKARANVSFHIGYPDPSNNGIVRFSHYLGIEEPSQLQTNSQLQTPTMNQQQHSQQQQQTSNMGEKQQNQDSIPAANLTKISIRRGCRTIVKCVENEKDWHIIQLILKELPNIMQNKALIQGKDVDSLAKTLYKMYADKSILDTFYPISMKQQLSDFHALVLPALTSLATYHQHLDQSTQKRIVEALKQGLFSRVPKLCVQTLTILILEMPETIVRQLPDVLLEMSKMSNTVTLAIPVLEFLSTLSRLPNQRFANFIQVQYMYVFAISLPYTNPYRFDHYTVSLAHHVVAGWFLKCRLSMRKNLVNYIIQGLESNVHMPFQVIKSQHDFSTVNEDSSNRKRSSSLTEQGSRRRPNLPSQRPKSDLKPLINDELYKFHTELAETCIDFMSRHTYSPCSALPKRIPTADFLLTGGQTMTWLVGHNLVTITTSCCSASPFRNGFCDRCYTMCKSANQQLVKSESSTSTIPLSPESSISSKDNDAFNKRYTKASFQHSSGGESESTELTSSAASSAAVTPFAVPQTHGTRFSRQNSQEGRFSNSSGSLETLSRRGSNPDSIENSADHNNINKSETALNTNKLLLPQMPILATSLPTADRPRQLCACCCTGWAEIWIRRPTGSISWIMRIQNQISYDSFTNEFPLHDLTSLFMPSLGGGVVGSNFMNPKQTQVPITTTSSSSSATTTLTTTHTSTPTHLTRLDNSHPSTPISQKQQEMNEIVSDSKSNVIHAVEHTLQNVTAEIASRPVIIETQNTANTEFSQNMNIQSSSNILSNSHVSGPIDIPGNLPKRKDSEESDNEFEENGEKSDVAFDDDPESKSRNPVRRVNSSPEMSSNWRNPFNTGHRNSNTNDIQSTGIAGPVQMESITGILSDHDEFNTENQHKKKGYGKDMRVSCEAIPEEIAGSTPPSLIGSMSKEYEKSNCPVDTTFANDVNVKQNTFPNFTSSSSTISAIAETETKKEAPGQTIVPRKQHSADEILPLQKSDILIESQIQPISPLQSTLILRLPMEMQKVTSKPPQSPAPLSPRLLARNAANKFASASGTASPSFPSLSGGNQNDNDMPRGRSKTISVVREHYTRDTLKWTLNNKNNNNTRHREQQSTARSGISPSFIFLQLFHSGKANLSERPIRVDPSHEKAIALLDLIPPFETHKIGVLYVGPGQCNNQTEILKNRFGSLRYAEFLRNIGTLVAIDEAKEHNLFIDLEYGRDGNFTYIWQDDIVHVTFHVATLMPNKKQDPNCNEKKKHIGNDFVTIVYNESGEEFNINTMKGQFNYAGVIVQPLELNTNRIFVRAKEDIAEYVSHSESKIVSDNSAPLLARQLALHANLASLVSISLKTRNQSPYASNWLERLRKIKHLKNKLLNEANQSDHMGGLIGSSGSSGTSNNTPGGNVGGAGSGINQSSVSSNVASGGSHSDLSAPRTAYIDNFTVYTQ